LNIKELHETAGRLAQGIMCMSIILELSHFKLCWVTSYPGL